MKQTAFCKWHNKPLAELSERERQRCYEDAGLECESCENMTRKGDEDEEDAQAEDATF